MGKGSSVKYSCANRDSEAICLVVFVWDKPVVTLYRDRRQQPEREPFAVVKASKLTITQSESNAIEGNLQDFFALMGNLDYISSKEGECDRYIACWFDDKDDDFDRAGRRLIGVTFSPGIRYVVDERGKRTYNANFKAEYGKLE